MDEFVEEKADCKRFSDMGLLGHFFKTVTRIKKIEQT